MKKDYDDMQRKYEAKEKQYSDIEIDFDLTTKKLEQVQKTIDGLQKKKEELLKELKQSRFEVVNLQESNQTLNRRLMQTISDKDTQISQLQQSVMRKYLIL